jgi:hypothetical protein
MKIENLVAGADVHNKPESYETGVLYRDLERDLYFIKETIYTDPTDKRTESDVMVSLGNNEVELIMGQLEECRKLLERISSMEDQYKNSYGYNIMKAQMWCDIAREKDVDFANVALKNFELQFQGE